MSAQYDLSPGLNISALSSASAAQLMQLISQAAPLSNIGGIIFQATTPDVASNPRFARYIWMDSSTDPAVPKYYNAGGGTWSAVAIAALSLTNAEISASAAIAVTKLATGTARYVLRTNAAGTANEFVAPAATLNSDELPVVKLTSNGGTDGYLKSVSGVTQWISNATERTAIAASLNSLAPTVLAPGANSTLLGTDGSGTVKFDAINNLIANGDVGLAKLAAGGASTGDILRYSGTNWEKATPAVNLWSGATVSTTGIVVGALGAATVFTQAHGLGARPKLVRVVIVCTSADLNYAVNDEVEIGSVRVNATFNSSSGVSADATNVVVTLVTAAGNELPDKATGAFAAMTEANWNLKIYAWL